MMGWQALRVQIRRRLGNTCEVGATADVRHTRGVQGHAQGEPDDYVDAVRSGGHNLRVALAPIGVAHRDGVGQWSAHCNTARGEL